MKYLPVECPNCGKIAAWQKLPGESKRFVDGINLNVFKQTLEVSGTDVYKCSECGHKEVLEVKNY